LVEVDYVFENTGSTDVTTEVAFPLPDLSLTTEYFSPLNIPFQQDPNFIGFQVWIDGREIKPEREIRAFSKNEITADLKRLGVDPLYPDLSRPDVVEALRRLDVIIDGGIDPKTNVAEPVAEWSASVSFHWPQTFPAGKRIAVRHSYRPAYGNSYAPPDSEPNSDSAKHWCFDNGFNEVERRLYARQREAQAKQNVTSTNSSDFYVNYDNVQYVLKTGANWKGPIGRFELQIDKGGAELMSTCPIPGLHLQRAPYGFNAVANDYTPTSDLDILFVSGHWLGHADGTLK
jgi:hypothetical protein